MRILKKKQTITVQYGLETALAFALAFAQTSMRNQRKGTEALQTDVNDILYVLLSKMGYWYAFTVIPSKLSLCEWIGLIWEAPHERASAPDRFAGEFSVKY